MRTTGLTAEQQEGLFTPARITPWRFDDPWQGHTMTEGSARAQAYYAQQMHDAAMRGQLDKFLAQQASGNAAA